MLKKAFKYVHKSFQSFLKAVPNPDSKKMFCMLNSKKHADVAVVNYIIHCLDIYSSLYLSCFHPALCLAYLKERNFIIEN